MTQCNTIEDWIFSNSAVRTSNLTTALWPWTLSSLHKHSCSALPVPCPVRKIADNLEVISSGRRACWSAWSNCWLSHYCSWTQVNCWRWFIRDHLLLTLSWSWCCWWFGWLWDCLKEQNFISALVRSTKYIYILLFTGHYLNENEGHTSDNRLLTGTECLMWSVA